MLLLLALVDHTIPSLQFERGRLKVNDIRHFWVWNRSLMHRLPVAMMRSG